jgi:hypothetical protein
VYSRVCQCQDNVRSCFSYLYSVALNLWQVRLDGSGGYPHHFGPDPDPAYHFDADPDPTVHSITDPDPNFQFDVDLDTDPTSHFFPDLDLPMLQNYPKRLPLPVGLVRFLKFKNVSADETDQ